MAKKCIKCGYVRDDELDKSTPDYECPRCGVIYAKAENAVDLTIKNEQKEDKTKIDPPPIQKKNWREKVKNPPTTKQLLYARDLGINIPDDATKDVLSDLISQKLDNDKPTTDRLRNFGRRYGIDPPEHIGKKALFRWIKKVLAEPGREKELLEWFVFRVYRSLVHGEEDVPIKSPDHSIIKKISNELIEDERVMKSIHRYDGEQIIWFGEFTAPNGITYNGGSKNTIAFKRSSKMLRAFTDIPMHTGDKTSPRIETEFVKSKPNKKTKEDQKNGCLVIFWLAVLLYLLAKVF